MNDEQFEKDRRNGWAQTRVTVDELKGIRKAFEALVVIVFVFAMILFLTGLALVTQGGG